MADRGRKNPAGGWLLGQMVERGMFAVLVWGAVTGVALGLCVFGNPVAASRMQTFPWWYSFLGALCLVGLALGLLTLVARRTESTWGRGLGAERHVADRIEHALVWPGCAFAHDVKEALDGPGNVDHVVLTPAGVWVVETKAAEWLEGDRFTEALQQTAANVARVRRELGTTVLVRGALVLANNQKLQPSNYDWKGEPVTAFGVVSFWRSILRECKADRHDIDAPGQKSLARKIWGLGSSRHWMSDDRKGSRT